MSHLWVAGPKPGGALRAGAYKVTLHQARRPVLVSGAQRTVGWLLPTGWHLFGGSAGQWANHTNSEAYRDETDPGSDFRYSTSAYD